MSFLNFWHRCATSRNIWNDRELPQALRSEKLASCQQSTSPKADTTGLQPHNGPPASHELSRSSLQRCSLTSSPPSTLFDVVTSGWSREFKTEGVWQSIKERLVDPAYNTDGANFADFEAVLRCPDASSKSRSSKPVASFQKSPTN